MPINIVIEWKYSRARARCLPRTPKWQALISYAICWACVKLGQKSAKPSFSSAFSVLLFPTFLRCMSRLPFTCPRIFKESSVRGSAVFGSESHCWDEGCPVRTPSCRVQRREHGEAFSSPFGVLLAPYPGALPPTHKLGTLTAPGLGSEAWGFAETRAWAGGHARMGWGCAPDRWARWQFLKSKTPKTRLFFVKVEILKDRLWKH